MGDPLNGCDVPSGRILGPETRLSEIADSTGDSSFGDCFMRDSSFPSA